MGEAAETFRQIEEYLQEQTDMLYKEYVKQQEDRWIISHRLLREKEILQSYVVKRVLELAAGGKKDVFARHVDSGTGDKCPSGLRECGNRMLPGRPGRVKRAGISYFSL